MDNFYICPAHGPHQQENRVCPGCLKSDFERMERPVPLDIAVAAHEQAYFKKQTTL